MHVNRRSRSLLRLSRAILIFGLTQGLIALAADWTTYGHDPARTGWAREEKIINPSDVSKFKLQWKTHVNNQSYSMSALTSPVVASVATDAGAKSIVYVAGIGGTVFALDAQSGEEVWSRSLKSMATPKKGGFQGTFLCPNGITATPVIDKETNNIYVIAPDGALYGLDLATGAVRFGPSQFVAPFAKSWSLNLVDGTVYTTISLGCGNGRAGIYAADIRNPKRPSFQQLLLSNAYTAGIWGRGGVVIGDDGKLFGGTADGDVDPTKGDYSDTVVAASIKDLKVTDYFLPPDADYLKKNDFDVGSASPVWFKWHDRNLLAHGFKEGIIYLLDADQLGSKDHRTPLYMSPRLGNDRQSCCDGTGIWGSLAAYRDENGDTWLFVPMGGPPAAAGPKFPITNGDNPHGSIMAFKVVADPKTQNPTLQPAWISADFHYPEPPVIANGVVFAVSNGENPDQHVDEARRFENTRPAILEALDAKTGKELFNSGSAIETWVHFSGLAVADGRVYAIDHNSNVYCFGIGDSKLPVTSAKVAAENHKDELSTSWIGRAERQQEYLRTWILRGGATAALVVLTALAAICLALLTSRKSPGL